MKNLKSVKAFIIVLMMFYTSHITAQTNANNNVPANITTAFAAKYPKATIKNWKADNNCYTAKVRENGRKYYATFDQRGNWIKTTIKLNWPWKLSPAVRHAFNKSKYGAWHIYAVNNVETPSGQFYQLMVDNANHPIDAFHQDLITEDHSVEVRADGTLIKEDITDNASL